MKVFEGVNALTCAPKIFVPCCFPDGWISVPSPGSVSPVVASVTPARPSLRATPASLYRQAGRTHTHTFFFFCLSSWHTLYLQISDFKLDTIWQSYITDSCVSLLLSDSQGPRCFRHLGSRRSNTSIHGAHTQECIYQYGESQTHSKDLILPNTWNGSNPFNSWYLLCVCVEPGRQRLDQQHVHVARDGNGEHQLLHRRYRQPELSAAEGGRPRRGRWAKPTHPCYRPLETNQCPCQLQ